MAALDPSKLKIEKKILHKPSLKEIKALFENALSKNFAESNVEIVECPDLTQEPFTLATQGLCGNPILLEVGGPPFLLPSVQRDKIYDIQSILQTLEYNTNAFVIGAGAGPWPYLKSNCELMMNLLVSKSESLNRTHIASVNKTSNECVLQTLPQNETRFALLANLFVSKGESGQVLKVHAKKRIGNNDFIATMQKALANNFTSELVGLGGTFLISNGKVKQHVMPDFSNTPLNTPTELDNWLRFYNMSTPLVAVGTFVSSESDVDLRVQHFHSFSHHGEGGHYHIDTTPDTVEYLGYFSVGDILYRIDQPSAALQFGKD